MKLSKIIHQQLLKCCLHLQVFGEPKGQASRALPDGAMDSTMGQLAGVGMGAAAVLLFAHLLKGAAL